MLHRISLQAVSVIKDQIYLVLSNVQQIVPTHSSLHLVSHIWVTPVSRLTRVQVIDSEPTNPSGKALVEPEFTPPVHSNEVTEPLVSKLMSNNVRHPVAVAVCGCCGIEKQCGSTGLIFRLGLSSAAKTILTDRL